MNWIRDSLNPGWVGSVIGLISVIVAFVIYRASLVGARPVYQQRSLRLIGPDTRTLPEAVEIRFRGEPVERLTKTLLVLWNSGRTLLRGSDVVATDPIRCEFSEGSRVLEVRIVKRTRDTNKVDIHVDADRPHCAIVTFDYLDPGDGVVLEMLHTDVKGYPNVNGTIRGVPKGIVDWGRILQLRRMALPSFIGVRTVLLVPVALGVLATVLAVLLPDEMMKAREATLRAGFRVLLFTSGMFYIGLPLFLFWRIRRRFPRNLTGPELEE